MVGAGMVGHRFVEELVARDRDAPVRRTPGGGGGVRALQPDPAHRGARQAVRRRGADARRGRPSGSSVQRGVAATSIDRGARTVELDDGTALGYDHLVLATGARAFVPPIDGLDGDEPPRHVHVLRTIDDCRERGRPHGQRPARRRPRRRGPRARGGLRPGPPRARGHRRAPRRAPDGRPARPGRRRPCWPAALDDLGVRVHTSTSRRPR